MSRMDETMDLLARLDAILDDQSVLTPRVDRDLAGSQGAAMLGHARKKHADEQAERAGAAQDRATEAAEKPAPSSVPGSVFR